MTSDEIMSAYNAARKSAGYTSGDTCWRFYNGWYSVGYGRYRRKQIEQMTANLLARAVKAQRSPGGGA